MTPSAVTEFAPVLLASITPSIYKDDSVELLHQLIHRRSAAAPRPNLLGVVLARRFGVPRVVDDERLSAPVAAVVALGLGAVLAASASLGVALGWTEPYWVPEPVLVLVLYVSMGKRERIRGKALGTALGVVAVILWCWCRLPNGCSRRSA